MARSSSSVETALGWVSTSGGRGGDGDVLLCAGDGEAEFQFGDAADIDVQLRRDLRRHALGYDASGVVAGRQQFEGEAAFGIAGRGVARCRSRC